MEENFTAVSPTAKASMSGVNVVLFELDLSRREQSTEPRPPYSGLRPFVICGRRHLKPRTANMRN